MNLKKNIWLMALFLLPSFALAAEMSYLNFTVSNLSTTRIFFKSTDMFDFGKTVSKNQTKTITYDFPPKIINITLMNESNTDYELLTDSSCDQLGWPVYRQLTPIAKGQDVKGMALYKAGEVHITVAEMPGSTAAQKRLTCSISN